MPVTKLFVRSARYRRAGRGPSAPVTEPAASGEGGAPVTDHGRLGRGGALGHGPRRPDVAWLPNLEARGAPTVRTTPPRPSARRSTYLRTPIRAKRVTAAVRWASSGAGDPSAWPRRRYALAEAARPVVLTHRCLMRTRTSRTHSPTLAFSRGHRSEHAKAGELRWPSAAMLCSARRRPSRAGRTRLPTRQRVDASEFLEASPVRRAVARGKPGRVTGEPSAYSVLSQRQGVVRGCRLGTSALRARVGEAETVRLNSRPSPCEAVQLKRGGVSRDGPANSEAAFAETVQLKRGGVSRRSQTEAASPRRSRCAGALGGRSR